MAMHKKNPDDPVVIKKYANRRLYDTGRSSYVTLEDLSDMVKEGTDFVVYDAKSGDDLTHSVLTQIIVEEESKGEHNLLPINFLRQLISFYGDSVQGLVPNYLEQSMQSFTKNQEEFRKNMNQAFGGMFPMGNLEDMQRQNMAMFQKAMETFSSFGNNMGQGAANTSSSSAAASKEQRMAEIQKTINELQKELNDLNQ